MFTRGLQYNCRFRRGTMRAGPVSRVQLVTRALELGLTCCTTLGPYYNHDFSVLLDQHDPGEGVFRCITCTCDS